MFLSPLFSTTYFSPIADRQTARAKLELEALKITPKGPRMPLINRSAELSQQQLTALQALASGAHVTAAAKAAGVHRSTVHNWCNDLSGFTAALRQSRLLAAQTVDDGLQSMTNLALDTIRHLLESDKTPASIKLKAAQSILSAVKDLAKPPSGLSEMEQIDIKMRTALENGILEEALAESVPQPAAAKPVPEPVLVNEPKPDSVRHISTLWPADFDPRIIFPLPPPIGSRVMPFPIRSAGRDKTGT